MNLTKQIQIGDIEARLQGQLQSRTKAATEILKHQQKIVDYELTVEGLDSEIEKTRETLKKLKGD